MAESPVDCGGKKRKFKSDENISEPPPLVAGDKVVNNTKGDIQIRPLPCRSPDSSSKSNTPRFYLSQRSPVLEVKSRFTFGTSSECLPTAEQNDGLARTSLLSQQFRDVRDSIPKTVPFGLSRRMSRSLPELRDLTFVSVLPDVEEEESEVSEFQEEIVYENPTRLPWHRKLDFIWCSVCHALGLSNIWRFPYYCYSNGGGSFVLPYLVFMMVCGMPFLCMELAVGQLTQSGPISAFGQLCPLLKGIGVASMVLSFWLTTYYSVLTSWTFFYTFNSFYSPPRWTKCTNSWNTKICFDDTFSDHSSEAAKLTSTILESPTGYEKNSSMLNSTTPVTFESSPLFNASYLMVQNLNNETNVTHSAVEFLNIKLLEKNDSISDTGELRFELLATVLFVWTLIYFALRKTDFFRGTTIYVLTIVSHLLLFSIFLRTVALEGGKNGLKHLFQPDWNQMFKPRVLLYALAQAFHSLGVVLGPSILMGSCHKQHNNLLRDTIVLACVTLLTVLIVGCITFATIGHIAVKMGKPFWTVISDDPGNVFVVYSVVISSMPLPSCWGVFFFLVLLCLGLDSEVKLMATLVSALKEAYTYYIKQRFQGHSLFLAVICGFCFAVCIPYMTQSGIFFFQLIDHYIAVIATVVLALFEVCTLSWLYGFKNLSSCIQTMTGKPPNNFYKLCWMILSPLTILIVLIYWCVKINNVFVKKDYAYPQWAHIIGWILFALTLCWIPILALAAYQKAPEGSFKIKLKATTQPRLRSPSECMWEAKPVIILNGSTVTASEFPDYKLPELPTVPNAVQTYVEKHSIMHQNDETAF